MKLQEKRKFEATILIISLSVIVCILGLPLDLLLPDATLYGMISKEMYLTGDYINLYSLGYDWLDKPHLPFWLTALSFHLFGMSNFAYKIPGVLVFCLGAVYTYKFAILHYNKKTALLSVVILITSFHSVLSNFDVRAEPFLTGFLIASFYYFSKYLKQKNFVSLIWASFFAGLAIMTKGIFAILPIAFGLGGHFLYYKDWKNLFNPIWVLVVAMILVFIGPELYGLYVQFDMHPEKVVFGQNNVSGLKFFFWDSQFGRFFNTAPIKGSGDIFFFLHTLLWAFLPWGLLFYIATFFRFKSFKKGTQKEMITLFGSLLTILIFSLSKFQLAHYTNIIFPLMAVLCADFVLSILENKDAVFAKLTQYLQVFTSIILVVLPFVMLYLFQQLPNLSFVGFVILSIGGFIWIARNIQTRLIQWMYFSAVSAILTYTFLMIHFYPTILPYQSGAKAALQVNKKHEGKGHLIDNKTRRFDFEFYLDELVERVKVADLENHKGAVFYSNKKELKELVEKNIAFDTLEVIPFYPITRLSLKFINPETRQEVLDEKYLIQIK